MHVRLLGSQQQNTTDKAEKEAQSNEALLSDRYLLHQYLKSVTENAHVIVGEKIPTSLLTHSAESFVASAR
jgi:hypothetical protein